MNQLNNNSSSSRSPAVKSEAFLSHEVEDISAKLDKQLGPEYISTRPGAGGVRVSYIEGWKALNLANKVFGFNGWFSEVKNIQVDYLDDRNGKYSVGLSVVVRVTLKDGSFHEDIGYGSLDNARTKAMAFEKAKKEAMTDGLKRALRCFGNAMGNCLYDKEYISKISGVKCAPPDFDETNLMRVGDAPSRSGTFPTKTSGELNRSSNHHADSERAAVEHAIRATVPKPQPPPLANVTNQVVPAKSIPEKRTINTPLASNKRPSRDLDDAFDDSLMFSDDINLESEDFNDEVNELLNSKLKTPSLAETNSEPLPQSNAETPTEEPKTNTEPSRTNQSEVIPTQIGFFKARVAEDVQKNLPTSDVFNPQFISPSIKRTLDPTKSTPVKRTSVPDPKAIRYDNPRLIPNRQVGKPRYPPPRQLRNGKDSDGAGTAES